MGGDLERFFPDMHVDDRTVKLVHIISIHVHQSRNDPFPQPVTGFDDDDVPTADRIGREHDPGDLGVEHFLYDDRRFDRPLPNNPAISVQ